MHRRTFLSASAAALAAGVACSSQPEAQPEPAPQAEAAIPILDTHVHLYDPTRPGGVPWPPETNTLIYKKTLPDRLRQESAGLGVVGAIEVECSPLLEDNQWVLDVIEKDTLMVGTIGDLEPDHPEFAAQLDRFGANPLFLGIRYGYLWGRDLREALGRPAFVEGVKLLASRGMTLDTANPSVRALEDVVVLTDKVPDLRVVLDHLPKLQEPEAGPERAAYETAMRALGQRPNVYAKVSSVLRKVGDAVPDDLELYRPKLDEMWGVFGEDRVVYGSDWPNSEPLGPYPKILSIVQRYASEKSREAQEKYFWRNSVKAYRWKKRADDQPQGA
ncbi:MAG: amidohydrolase family protein [Acidobacteria bacterium]|nr:amidohydrolase family protein [Acidobacteriota bacterium]